MRLRGLILTAILVWPTPSRSLNSRREFIFRGLGTFLGGRLLVGNPGESKAIINGVPVTQVEAASAGAVGLWIDLADCKVCRHDVPAACSGTLIAPDLVLSAKHCIDIPKELGGSLQKVVFSNNLFDKQAPSIPVAAFKTTGDYGIKSKAGDLVLIKLSQPAPIQWKPQKLSDSAIIGFPEVTVYGFGDTKDDFYDYSSGLLNKIKVQLISSVSGSAELFYTKPSSKRTGTCNGDSGGSALLVGATHEPLILGVVSSSTVPCEGSNAALVNPLAFADFIRRASADLGSPLTF